MRQTAEDGSVLRPQFFKALGEENQIKSMRAEFDTAVQRKVCGSNLRGRLTRVTEASAGRIP